MLLASRGGAREAAKPEAKPGAEPGEKPEAKLGAKPEAPCRLAASDEPTPEAPAPGGKAGGKYQYHADEGPADEDEPPAHRRPSVFARQDPQWEYFEIGPPRRFADEPASGTATTDSAEKRKLCTKASAGILLCRVHPHTNRPEVILVHKRYTYAFSEFVYGRYSRQNQKGLMALFEQMSTEELLDVWSLNFDQMWYRIWLSGPRRELFAKKHTKFYTSFIRDDGGRALHQMLRQVQDRGVPFWEIPKGRPNGKEGDLVCAMREFTEETGVEKKDYRLLPGVKRRVSFVHMGVRYVHVYYVAVAGARLCSGARPGWRRPVVPGRGVLSTADFMGEVDEVRWMDIEHVRFVDDGSGHLEAIIAPAFRLAKCFLRGRWDQRRARPANISGLDPGVLGALATLAPLAPLPPAPPGPNADGSEDAVGGPDRDAPQWGAKPAQGRPAAKNPGNEIFRALLSLEYGQGARRATRRAARRQRASAEKKSNQGAGPGARPGETKYDDKNRGKMWGHSLRPSTPVFPRNWGGTPSGRAGATMAPGAADDEKRFSIPPAVSGSGSGSDSRGQSPAPGGSPRPSTPDQIARLASAISRSRTPSAEALLKNLTLTEIYPAQPGNVAVAGPLEAAAIADVAPEEQARDPNQSKKRETQPAGPAPHAARHPGAAPSAARLPGNSGSYAGALGLGAHARNATQASSATDGETQAAAPSRRKDNRPALGKCESQEGTFSGLREERDSAGRKAHKASGAPERRKAASSADEGWSFVQRRGSKRKQATDEKNARPADASAKAASRFDPRRGRKDR
jgi:8-oxo-dGTP pyrophosphatase MutT (NUDIX family)